MISKNIERATLASGFSLVELVIVIVILGIIAAVALPRITTAGNQAQRVALEAGLKTVRDAIDRYYLEHNNTWPGQKTDGINAAGMAKTFVNQLMLYSNITGEVTEKKQEAYPYGPYIRGTFPTFPAGKNKGKDSVTVVSNLSTTVSSPSDNTGWIYNAATGRFIANSIEAGDDGKPFDKY